MMERKNLVFTFADIEVREREFALIKAGEKVSVEPRAFRVLLHLLRNPQQLITKNELMDAVWSDVNVSDNSLSRSIALLRKLLGDDPREPRYIATVQTLGYRFLYDVQVADKSISAEESGPDAEVGQPVSNLLDLRSNSARRQIVRPREAEPSLLQRFFLFFGETPYRRWEIMHLRMILWCLLLACLGWRFLAIAPDQWGFGLFFLELGCLALLMTLLSFLVYTGASDRGNLLREVRRTAPWIRRSIVALVLVTWAMAGVAAISHRVLAAFLVLCSTTGGAKYLLFKAAFDRGAFPELSKK